jgi:hypothetical protein
MGKRWSTGPMPAEQKANLSAALKKRWASGERKPNPPEMYEVTSRKMRERYADGRHTWRPTKEMCSKGGLTVTEKQLATLRRIAKNKVGKPCPPGPSARGVDHWKAKFWVLVAPDKSIVAGVNMNEIVRRHAHMFEPEDLVPRGKSKSATKASKALACLFYLRRSRRTGEYYVPGTWKGWAAANNADMVKNIPDDCEVMLKPSCTPSPETAG